jgi:hypothetical protein
LDFLVGYNSASKPEGNLALRRKTLHLNRDRVLIDVNGGDLIESEVVGIKAHLLA